MISFSLCSNLLIYQLSYKMCCNQGNRILVLKGKWTEKGTFQQFNTVKWIVLTCWAKFRHISSVWHIAKEKTEEFSILTQRNWMYGISSVKHTFWKWLIWAYFEIIFHSVAPLRKQTLVKAISCLSTNPPSPPPLNLLRSFFFFLAWFLFQTFKEI